MLCISIEYVQVLLSDVRSLTNEVEFPVAIAAVSPYQRQKAPLVCSDVHRNARRRQADYWFLRLICSIKPNDIINLKVRNCLQFNLILCAAVRALAKNRASCSPIGTVDVPIYRKRGKGSHVNVEQDKGSAQKSRYPGGST